MRDITVPRRNAGDSCVTPMQARIATSTSKEGKCKMSLIATVQEAVDMRELSSVELDEIAGAFSWFGLLETACFFSPVCAAGYVGHMLFAES